MTGKINLFINTKCALGVFIFILTYTCLTNGVNSHGIRNSEGINQNTKEPPDLDTEFNNANIIPNLSVNKQRDGKTSSNPNQIRFLCRNRLPGFASRRNIPAQRTRSPYKIVVPPEVTPGQTIRVEIQSNIRNAFRGYMMQVLSSDVVLGEFQASPSVNLQTCYSMADTATSAIREKRNYATVFWKAPEDLQSNIVIRATVVKNYRTYWADVLSEEIPVQEKDIKDDPNQLKNDTQTDASNETTGGNGVVAVSNTATDDELEDLKQAVSDTFESIDGPLESLDEVLSHQGIRDVAKVNLDGKGGKEIIHNTVVSVDDELTAPGPAPRYVYREMNMHPVDFEPPQTSEFLSTMLKMGSMLSGAGNRGPTPGAVSGGSSMGGLGSMMNMMQMLGGGGGGGGGGGLMSSLGTMSKLSGMLGGGGGGGGMPGGLGALSSISGLLGGGGGGGGGAAPPPAAGGGGGGGLGGLGALSSIGSLLGFGKKKENAPPPVGQPVKPVTQNGEPSLADLLGVDPNSVVASPTVIPSEVNPLGGVAAAKSGGLLSSIGGFAPMLAGIPIAMTLFGGKKKQQQQPPWGQQGMQGQNGQFGQMPPGAPNGQFGQMGGANGQFGGMQGGQFGQMPGANGQFGQMPGANGQFGQMPGANGQFGQMPGANGQFGQMPGANGQFGQMPGANGQFGQMPGASGQFGQTAGGGLGTGLFGQTQSSSDTDRIIKLLEQQRMEIEALKTQLSGNSIVSKMGGFGNIPLSMGQTSSSLLGLSDSGSSLNSFGTTISPFSSISATPSSSGNDALLKQLMQQNQMLLQQNQQFNNMVTNSAGTNQFGASNPFSRVNRSNGQNLDSLNPSNNFPQNQNPIPGQNPFNNAGGTMGQFQNTGQNALGMNTNANSMMNNFQNQNNNMMSNGGGALGGQTNSLMNAGFNSVSGSQGMSGSSMTGNPPPAQGGGVGSLANMFGGSGASSGGSSGGLMSGLLGGDGGGGGGGGSPLAGLLGGSGGGGGGGSPLAGLLGGGGSGGSSPLAGLLGGGGGGGPDLSGLMQNVDMNAVQSVLGGKEGQDLMNNMMGMLQGPEGGNLMKAVEGVMSGNTDPSEIQNLMSGMDIGSLQQMASQAEGMLSKSGIDPSALMGLMG